MIEANLIFCQIIWFGLGLSLIYDTTEQLWHWPHLLVAGLYGGFLLASMALNRRTFFFLGFVTVLIFCLIYLPNRHADQSIFQDWYNMLAGRHQDYLCWGFVMGSSILGGRSLDPLLPLFWKRTYQILAALSFLVGCSFGMMQSTQTVFNAGTNWCDALLSEILNFIWLAYWGMPMKPIRSGEEDRLSRFFVQYLKLPLIAAILIIGACSYILYDWAFTAFPLWLQLIFWIVVPTAVFLKLRFWRFIPPANGLLMLRHKT